MSIENRRYGQRSCRGAKDGSSSLGTWFSGIALSLSWVALLFYILNLLYSQRVMHFWELRGVVLGDDFHESVASGGAIFLHWLAQISAGNMLEPAIWLSGLMLTFVASVWVVANTSAGQRKGRMGPRTGRVIRWLVRVDQKLKRVLSGTWIGGMVSLLFCLSPFVAVLCLLPFARIAQLVADNDLTQQQLLHRGEKGLLVPVAKPEAQVQVVLEDGSRYKGVLLLVGRLAYVLIQSDSGLALVLNAQHVKTIEPLKKELVRN